MLRLLLVVAAVAATSYGSSATRLDSACQSPNDACEDLWTSLQCKTTKQCIPKWEQMPVKAGNETELCALCKEMVKEARDQLESNQTQDELRQVLEGSCDILVPLHPLKVACKKLMNAFIEQLNDILVSRMDPTQVCTVSGLCYTSKPMDIVATLQRFASSLGNRESQCETFIGKLQENLAMIPDKVLIDSLVAICDMMGSEKKCSEMADTHFKETLRLLRTSSPKDVCDHIKNAIRPKLSSTTEYSVGGDLQCEFCEAMIHKVVVQFNNTTTKSQVRTVLQKLCQKTGSWKDECMTRVDKDFDIAYDDVIALLNGPVICSGIGLCSAKSLPLTKMTAALELYGGGSFTRDAECTLCTLAAQALENALFQDKNVETVESLMHAACKFIPTTTVDVCEDFVSSNLPHLIRMFRDRYDSAYVCTELVAVCPSKSARVPKAHDTQAVCDYCEKAAEYIVKAIENDKSKQNIEAVLEKVCTVIPVDSAKCQQYIDQNLDKLYELLRKDLTVAEICQSIGLCSQRVQVYRAPALPAETGGCELCKILSDWVLSEIGTNKSEAAILSSLEKVCNIIPGNKKQCQNIIDVYGSLILQYVQADLTSAQICSTIQLCTAGVTTTSATCDFCTSVTAWLEKEIETDKSEAAIKKALERFCDATPMSKDQCHSIVDKYAEELIQFVVNNTSPLQFCAEIGLCPKAQVQVTSFESEESCELCKVVSNWILSEIGANKSEAAILSGLEKVCKFIPGNKKQCQNIIDVYGSLILQYVQADLTSAQICSTIRICAASGAGTDGKCDLCTSVLGWVKEEIEGDKAEEAIKSALERVCNVLPIEKAQCKHMVDTYSEELIRLLVSEMTPQEICAELGLCPKAQVTRSIVKNDQSCEMCKILAQTLLDELKGNTSEALILSKLERVCNVLPMDKAECKNIVDVYGDKIIQAIRDDLTADEICSTIRMCMAAKSSRLQSVERKPAVASKDNCYMCTIVLDTILADISNNKTESRIVEALDRVCSIVPRKYKDDCDGYVTMFGDKIVKLILSEANSATICAEIGLCSKPLRSDNSCSLCQIVVDVVDAELQNNNTQDEIEKALQKACSMLPTKDQRMCSNMVNVYTTYVIEMIENFATPDEVCQTFKFCPTPPTNLKCEVCEFVTNYVESSLTQNRTKAEIEALLEKVCDIAPKGSVDDCKATVDQYADMIITLAMQMMPPRRICEEIKLCPVARSKIVVKKPKDEKCSFCKWLVGAVEEKILDNRTEAAIKSELEKLCTYVQRSADCKLVIDLYLDEVVGMIIKRAKPETICEAINKCPKPAVPVRSVRISSGESCSYCKTIVNFAADEIKDETTDEEIIKYVEKVCDSVPASYRKSCQVFVETKGTIIVRMLAQSIDSEKICEAVKFCPLMQSRDEVVCTWCQYALHFIQGKLYDNATQQMIQEDLDKLCKSLPSQEMASECKEFVDAYAPSMEVVIAQKLDPSLVCPAIGACPKSRATIRSTSATARCYDCVNSLGSFRHKPTDICQGTNKQFFDECQEAAVVGSAMLDQIGHFKMCKFARRCGDFSGRFDCNLGGCKYVL